MLEIEGFRLTLPDYTRRLHSLGPNWIAVTQGAEGAMICDGQRLHHQPAIQTEVIGTVGAGDAFASTLAAGLVRGDGMERAALLAARNAAAVVGHVDAQTGLLPLALLRQEGVA